MTENVGRSDVHALADVSAVGKADALGYRNDHAGVHGKSFAQTGKEGVEVKRVLGQINKVGRDAVYGASDRRGGSEPARVASHYLNYGDCGEGVYRAVAYDLLHGDGNVFRRRAEAGGVVGHYKVVVNGLGNAHYTHFVIVRAGVLRKLGGGVHRIVAADVEKVADVVFSEYGKQLFVHCGVVTVAREFFAAGAERCGGGVLKASQLFVGVEQRAEVNETLLEQSLNSVPHAVYFADGPGCNAVKSAANDPGKCRVYRGCGASRLADDDISVKLFHFNTFPARPDAGLCFCFYFTLLRRCCQ